MFWQCGAFSQYQKFFLDPSEAVLAVKTERKNSSVIVLATVAASWLGIGYASTQQVKWSAATNMCVFCDGDSAKGPRMSTAMGNLRKYLPGALEASIVGSSLRHRLHTFGTTPACCYKGLGIRIIVSVLPMFSQLPDHLPAPHNVGQ